MNRLLIISTLLIFSCAGPEESDQESSESIVAGVDTTSSLSEPEAQTDEYSFVTVENDTIGWGYQIMHNGKLYVNQPHVPAIPGVQGFDNEGDAATTAKFAIYKIENGFLPPTITKEELDSLGVIPEK